MLDSAKTHVGMRCHDVVVCLTKNEWQRCMSATKYVEKTCVGHVGHVGSEKASVRFHFTGWLIGTVRMSYFYPHI